MNALSDADALARATAALSHPGLVRIISDIDDNGPLQRHLLSRTLTGLPRQQLRHATAAGRALGLLRTRTHGGTPALVLTSAGKELADVYDTAARWARTHHYPCDVSDFVTRVQATLTLLGTAGGEAPHAPQAALASWVRDHAAALGYPLTGTSPDEMQLAA
ncbi:regulator [Streptomyces virginiae]|uniref:regulator n=1 Tax=Streptomyces virginiae TaxID=1961 RepID=UPI00365B25FA